MFLRQALRYRPWQTIVLVFGSTLIAACAAFGPWFARAVEQSVTTTALTERRTEVAWNVNSTPPLDTLGATATAPETLETFLPPEARKTHEQPLYEEYVAVKWSPAGKRTVQVEGRLAWREGFCEHIRMVSGSCPTTAGQVAISTADRDNFRLDVGDSLRAVTPVLIGGGNVTVSGVYQTIDPRDPFWYGAPPTGRSVAREGPAKSESDHLLTPRVTFGKTEWGHTAALLLAPIPGKLRVDGLAALIDQTHTMNQRFTDSRVNASADSTLEAVVADVTADREQATTIIPLVMVQVAIFGLVVLALAAAAVVDQRRPEIAIARLRGRSPRQAGRTVITQLGVPVLLGTLTGLLAAFGLVTLVRHTWLAGTTPAEITWPVIAATAAAAVAGLATIVLAVRPVVRQPVATLLRTVPPRHRSRHLGLLDVIVITLAAAGLLATVSGDGRGPLAILTPTLLALAAGLTAAHLLLPVAARIAPGALRRGRIAFGLGALNVARRTAVTRIVAVVAVATALVAFAGQASSIAGRNRDTRAGYETGAAAVLELAGGNTQQLPGVLDGIDKDRRWLTPVVLASPTAPEGLSTMMIEPDSFRRIAYGAEEMTDPETYRRLTATDLEGAEVQGRTLQVTVAPTRLEFTLKPAPTFPDGTPQGPAETAPTHVTVRATLLTGDGHRTSTVLGDVPVKAKRPTTLSAPVGCITPCRLLGLTVARSLGDAANLTGTLDLTAVRTDSGPVTGLGGGESWLPINADLLPDESVSATAHGSGLRIEFTSNGTSLSVQHASVPTPVPMLIAKGHTVSEGQTSPGLDGIALPVTSAGTPSGPVPRYLRHVAVTDLETMRRWGGVDAAGKTVTQLWLTREGLAHVDEIAAGLKAKGIGAAVIDRLTDRESRYARSASALALRLTPVVGTAAWSLAVIVLLLLAVTTWRSRAHDYASLRISGVPSSVTARAARWEQTWPVALATVLGTACGVIGAQLALPLIPLFSAPLAEVPFDLGVAGTVAVVTLAVSTVILTATTMALGTGLNRRATYARITEEIT